MTAGLCALIIAAAPTVAHSHAEMELICAVIQFCLAAAFLALWIVAPDYRVFAGMSFYLALFSLNLSLFYFRDDREANPLLVAITAPVVIVIAAQAMRITKRRWTWIVWPICFAALFSSWSPHLAFLRDWPINVTQVVLGVLVVQGFLSKSARDRQIAAAFLLLFCTRWTVSPEFRALTHVPVMIETGRWNWPISPLSTIVLGAATLVIFVRDLVRDRREKLRMGMELEAARAVQQVLIPDRQPATPGIAIQSVYQPFGEVGGDFFQILPMADGGVMVVIGDVSGKGLPAAMMVALLVGTLNTLAEHTSGPGEMLAGLNRRVLGRSGGGFTTCLVARIEPGGELTLASAGHIPPYLDGREVALENGLPLGVAPGVEYSEVRIQLAPSQQLTVMTDGVLEARDASGELFGFERTAAHSNQSAQDIARAASTFGQDDDITVLTVVRSLQVVNA